jgi:hypothetical protein
MTNATYCDSERQKDCEHWDADNKKCEYMRKDKTCFIGGIEKKYEKRHREKIRKER